MRPLRIQFPGACFWVLLEGNGRQALFATPEDRRFFLKLLAQAKERFGLKVYAYCLTERQVQLLVEIGRYPLSRAMQALNTRYSRYFNKTHGLTGHVFRGRYRSYLVDKENHLAEMTYHIHLEPARADVKDKPWRYAWSSCLAYVEGAEKEPLVDSDPILQMLGKKRLKQSVHYLKELQERMKTSLNSKVPTRRGCVGGPDFAASVGLIPDPAWEQSSRKQVRAILNEAAAQGADRTKLFGPSRWRDLAEVRRKTIHRLWKEAKLGVSELSRLFHRTPSAISQAIKQVELASEKPRPKN